MTRGELIGKIHYFLKKQKSTHKYNYNFLITQKLLLYLTDENLITLEEANNIEKFRSIHIDNTNNIIYFKLIEQLYNKHINQNTNGTKPELDKEST